MTLDQNAIECEEGFSHKVTLTGVPARLPNVEPLLKELCDTHMQWEGNPALFLDKLSSLLETKSTPKWAAAVADLQKLPLGPLRRYALARGMDHFGYDLDYVVEVLHHLPGLLPQAPSGRLALAPVVARNLRQGPIQFTGVVGMILGRACNLPVKSQFPPPPPDPGRLRRLWWKRRYRYSAYTLGLTCAALGMWVYLRWMFG